MLSDIKYRILNSSDAESYRQIRLECLKNCPDNFGSLYEDEINAAALKFDKTILQEGSTDFLLGAFDKNTLIGICGYMQEQRMKTKHNGEISHMYVMPAYGGSGIGTSLLKLTLERAFSDADLKQITLGVVHTNTGAINIYKNNGFVQYGILEDYFKQDVGFGSLVLMVLTREDWHNRYKHA